MRKEASFISIATACALIGVAVSGGMYVGALASDVETLEKQEVQRKEDHDTLVTLRADVGYIKRDMKEVKNDVKDVKALLEDIKRAVQ